MAIVEISKAPVEQTGRNWVGNIYKYRWVVYATDDRKEPYGLQKRIKGVDVNIKKVFTGTLPEVKKWVKENEGKV